MNNDFLENFEKRMEKLSYTYMINAQLDKKTVITEKYNLQRQDLLNLIYATLCLIMDKSLKDEDCLIEDIEEFIYGILVTNYKMEILPEHAKEIARYIVIKVLRNDGKQFGFKIVDFNNDSFKVLNYYLIKSEPSIEDKTVSSYKLTDEGYKLLLNTYEIDQRLQVEIQNIILTESLKRKNFKGSLSVVRQLDSLMSSQIDSVKNMIKSIRENIFEINQKDFSETYLKNIEIINEQKNKLKFIERLILTTQEDINKAEILTDENIEALNDLNQVKKYIDRLILKSTTMVDSHFDYKSEYLKALKAISENFNQRHLSFNKTYLKPIEGDLSRLNNFNLFFSPMFKLRFKKHLNYNKLIDEFSIIQESSPEQEVDVEDIDKTEMLEDLENKRLKNVYKDALAVLFKYICKNEQETLLSAVIEEIANNPHDYEKLASDIRIFSELIINLLRLGTLNFEDIYSTSKDTIFDASAKFDIVEAFYELYQQEIFGAVKEVQFVKKENTVFDISESMEKEGILYSITMNDLMILKNKAID